MTTNKRKQKEPAIQILPSSNKRACLKIFQATLSWLRILQASKGSHFISQLQAREWKKQASLVRSYIQNAYDPENSPNQMMTVLNGTLRKIVEHKDAETEQSKQRFRKEYMKLINEYQIEEMEKEAEIEARQTSRILTTIEARALRQTMQQKLDQMFDEDETEEQGGLHISATLDGQAFATLDDPFVEEKEEEVVKEKNIYKYQAPAQNIISPHKPIIQASDLGVLRDYFDTCIGTSQDKATEETKQEFMSCKCRYE